MGNMISYDIIDMAQYEPHMNMGHMNINIPIMKNKAFPIYFFQLKLTSKFPSNGLEKFLRIVGNVNGKRTEVETGMNLSCRSIG